MDKHLHIICLNVPYPVDYGGVFDLFYKLPALQQEGVRIHLHCFDYGRGEQPELNKYCESVHYYKRLSGLKGFSIAQPYIVSSRRNEELLQTLLEDDYPILMEGVHCTYLLTDTRFNKRKRFVRLHNTEHIYYRHLYQSSSFGFKKLYYGIESWLLKRYEKAIVNKAVFLSVSEKDVLVYKSLGCKTISILPLFLPAWKVSAAEGRGTFCLYQGDLSVHENQKAASWLLKNVFDDINIPFVVAGKNPPQWLTDVGEENNNVCIVADPEEKEMQDMIAKAQINVIPSFNNTGIKLKLVNALYNGKHCVVNKSTVEGTGLESLCCVADDAASFKLKIINLFKQPFSQKDISVRQTVLNEMFDNKVNAEKLTAQILGELVSTKKTAASV